MMTHPYHPTYRLTFPLPDRSHSAALPMLTPELTFSAIERVVVAPSVNIGFLVYIRDFDIQLQACQ